MSAGSLHAALHSTLQRVADPADRNLVENEIAAAYGVSRSTVRAALSTLADEGVISRTPRRGTQLTEPFVVLSPQSPDSSGGIELRHHGRGRVRSSPVTRAVLRSAVAEHLAEEETGWGGGSPLFHTRRYLDRPEDFDRAVTTAQTAFEASVADRYTADMLQIDEGTPVLLAFSVRFGSDGLPVAIETTVFPASRVVLQSSDWVHGNPALWSRQERAGAGSLPDRRRTPGELHSELRAGIRMHVLSMGDRLSVVELMADFDVSRNTALVALSRLADEGLIDRSPRRGTHLVSHIAQIQVQLGLVAKDDPRGRWVRLASRRMPAPAFVDEILGPEQGLVDVSEFLYEHGQSREQIYVLYSVPGPNIRQLSDFRTAPFDELFRRAYGVDRSHNEVGVSVVRAPHDIAWKLDMEPGSLCLLQERIVVGRDGRPREFSHSYYRGSQMALVAEA